MGMKILGFLLCHASSSASISPRPMFHSRQKLTEQTEKKKNEFTEMERLLEEDADQEIHEMKVSHSHDPRVIYTPNSSSSMFVELLPRSTCVCLRFWSAIFSI